MTRLSFLLPGQNLGLLNMEVASVRCTVKLERISGVGGGAIASNRTIRDSELSLARNEFKEVILVVQDRDRKLRIPIRHEELVVHKRFAGEGKATVTVKDQKVTAFVSNAPPHHLCQFLKAMAAKLAGGRGAPALSARKKLLSGLPQSLDGISPVTQKDVANLKVAIQQTGRFLGHLFSPRFGTFLP